MKAPASEGKHPLYRTGGNITQSAFPWFRALSSQVSIWHQSSASVEVSRTWNIPLMCKDHVPDRRILSSFLYTQGRLKAMLEHCRVNHTFQANIFSRGLWYSSYCGMFCYVKNSLRGIYTPILFMEIFSYSQNTDICPRHREGNVIAIFQRESGCWSAPLQL